jgi:ATP-binding cassette subfamily F protein 3
MDAPHLLILDEPTNHLDIDSRRALLDALNDYEGAVILITHDRSLMELVADRLWLAADGGVKPFDGDMEDYAKFVLDRARVAARAPTQVAAEPAAAPPPKGAPPSNAAAMVLPLKRKLEAAEAVLARETRAAAELDKALADPTIFTRDPAKAADLGRQRAKKQEALDAAETKWIAAAEAYEMAKANA